jgi:DNA-binding Lrp family transcriptional regulator
LIDQGVIKRLGVVVRHHELGYQANAMVVWDVPDAWVDAMGQQLGADSRVTLCYQRPRVPGRWPYNLFCMVHGQDRDEVRQQVARLVATTGVRARAHKVLFSGRRFKQHGARYSIASSGSTTVAREGCGHA